LEDSLQSKFRRPKGESPYLWDRILKEQKKEAAKNSKVQKAPKKQNQKKKKTQRGYDAGESFPVAIFVFLIYVILTARSLAKSLEEFAKGARAITSEMESCMSILFRLCSFLSFICIVHLSS
jgi:hypothetical protein